VADVRERGTTFECDLAVKEHVLDLAIDGTNGAAFGAIVSSIIDDVFMPLQDASSVASTSPNCLSL